MIARTVHKKKLLLVFPPLTTPTSPPLGAAMLKGYVERTLPDWEVTILDLNLWCFQRALAALESREMELPQEIWDEMGATREQVLEAARIFRGDVDALFTDPALYDERAPIFLAFTMIYLRLLGQQCAAWERDQRLSPMLQEMVDRVLAHQPDCVGVSMIFTQQLRIGALLGRHLRQEARLKVYFGGSCFGESAEHFVRWYPDSADAIVVGDGEETLRKLLESNGDPTNVPGVVYRSGEEVVRAPPVFEKEIDRFGAPDFADLDLHAYYSPEPVVPLLLSRGCFWRKCTFCVHYYSAGDTYRLHSVEAAIETLRGFVARGIRNFSFVDEMIPAGHFARLARAIKEAGLDISYYALSKPNRSFTPAILKEMAESGCKYLLWGVESGSQRVLDLMGKGTKVDEMAEVLRDASAVGIANHVYVMCGFPTETAEEWAETLRYLDENRAHVFAIHRGVFALEAGSPIHRNPGAFDVQEVTVLQDTPLGGRLGHRCSSGLSRDEAMRQFKAAMPFFRAFQPHAEMLAYYRDHAVLVYKRLGPRLRPELRRFPPLPVVSEVADGSAAH